MERLLLQLALGAWTQLPRDQHASGVPARTTSPREAFDHIKATGVALLTDVDTSTGSGPLTAARDIFGDAVLALQAPTHVGTNNFGFRAGKPITNLDVRPPHVDTIANVFGPDEAPEYFLLCARRPAADGGGASYFTDLGAAIRRMPEPYQ